MKHLKISEPLRSAILNGSNEILPTKKGYSR